MAAMPSTSLLRKRKRPNVETEPIRAYVRKLAEEKRRLRDKTDPNFLSISTATAWSTPPHQKHSRYSHKRIVAVLAIGLDGFTLSNCAESVTALSVRHNLVKEVYNMKVRTLYCIDRFTLRRWLSLKRASGISIDKLKVIQSTVFSMIRCMFCRNKTCHRWNAAAGIAHLLKIPFDPVAHSLEQVPSYSAHRRQKVVAVLAVCPDGWTLCNGVYSVSVNGTPSNASLAQQAILMKVSVLDCFDEFTYEKWTDVRKSYEKELEKVKVSKLEHIEMKLCCYCKKKRCHRWNASVGLCHRYKSKLIFDPIVH